MKLIVLAVAVVLGVLIWWMHERRETDLYVTSAESLGTFLYSPANSTMPVGYAATPERRRLGGFAHGTVAVMFEFTEDRTFCVLYRVSGWPFVHRQGVDIVLTPR